MSGARVEVTGPGVPAAVLVPGLHYTVHHPLLFHVGQVFAAAGMGWVEVTWTGDLSDGSFGCWGPVIEQATEEAIAHCGTTDPIVVGKSIGTAAVSVAARHGLTGVWLTPILVAANELAGPFADVVRAGLEASEGPDLVIAGSNDGFFDASSVPERHRVIEVAGADHGLLDRRDARASARHVGTVVDAVHDHVERWSRSSGHSSTS